eukprot:Em0024g485a
MRAGAYEEHECVLTLTASEERAAAGLLKRAISTSSKGIIQLGTGGTPVTFMRITNPHNSTTAVCSRTLKSRCSELQAIRRVVSGGQPSVLLQNKVLSLGDEQRRALLKEAGISDEIKIGPAEVLAIKVGLAIPWNKIRILRRWLKASNISLACEERMRHASRKAVGDNLKGELAPFSFSLPSGGEEIRGAPLVFIPDLILKVVELLEENDRAGRLTWHNGVIPASEIWIKLGGDKGGGTFKMNFQIVNVAAPNSVNNTCVFCCFEADDSYTNLHIALERYKEQVEHLQGMTWRIWQRLSQHVAMLHPDPYIQSTLTIKNILHQVESGKQPNSFIIASVNPSLTSLLNSQELQRLHQYKVELQEAKQSESVLQQLATYMAVLIGESNPLTADLLHQSANTSKIVKQLQYFGGTFVSNHVHKTLKLPNINTLCSAICKLAESSLPQQFEMVATRTMIFLNAFSKFAKCHSIYDQNFIDEAQVHELEQSVQEFMELFRTNFPKGTIPIKMHMVEDHAVQWARSTHVGFGLLGEQGAESVHAKFNNLARAYSAIKGKKLENHFRKFVRLGLGKKEVALSMYLSVNVKLEPSQLPEDLEDLHLCCFRVTIVLAEKICSFHSLHMRCIFLMRSKYTIFTKCLVVWILYNHCHWYFQYNYCDCYCYCHCWTTTATARTTTATVPSAITGLFVEATTNPTFTFTMVAGSPAERMTVAIVTLAVATISLILLAIRKCIVRKDGDERAGPTDVFESVKVHPSPQKIDAAFLGNLPNLEQNDMSFSDALVTTPEGFIQNGLDEMFDGMNLDKSRTDYVDESMFLREASDQES